MKTIGLIGGLSWESTVTYYQVINRELKALLGGRHSAKLLLASLDFDEVERCLEAGDWAAGARLLGDAAVTLEKAGADYLFICTNTMHKVADEIQARLSVPLVHIAETTADALVAHGIRSVGLLGTRHTMTQPFFVDCLRRRGIAVCVPDAPDVAWLDHVIYDELCEGIFSAASRTRLLRLIDRLREKGVEGVILGCTEIGLLLGRDAATLPLFDTALLHACRAAELAAEEGYHA